MERGGEREKVEETTRMRNNIRTSERGKNARERERERERESRNKIYPLRAYMSLWERFLSKSP